jgi:hypothetical protein
VVDDLRHSLVHGADERLVALEDVVDQAAVALVNLENVLHKVDGELKRTKHNHKC